MTKLPDGSAFFTNTVGPREPGVVNIIKYTKIGYARRWLFYYRMIDDIRYFTRQEEGKSWSILRAILWVYRCT